MKTKLLAISSVLGAVVLGSILPRVSYAFSIVPDKCIQSKTGCDACDFVLILTNISSIITGLLGSIALLMFIVGGLLWILSGGNEQRIESGKKILKSTITGLIIVMFAWIGVNYVVRLAYKANMGTGTEAKVFSKDWWAPTCSSSVKTCAGALVGDSCGTVGDCQAKEGAPCTCFRNQKPEGDFGVCGSKDATNISDAAKSYENCYCADQCSQLNYREGYTSWKWSCKKQSEIVGNTKLETATAAAVPCPTAGYACVGEH